jgi:peptide chain release factor 1
LAAQHSSLTKQLEGSYDSKIAKRAGELGNIASALKSWDGASAVSVGESELLVPISNILQSLDELQLLLRDPSNDAELKDLANQDLEITAKQLQEASDSLTKSLLPKHPFADLPCLIEIRPGVGGREASLFAGELLSMYQAFCSNQGLRTNIISDDWSGGEDSMLLGAIVEVESVGSYGLLRGEAGIHRVQRVPETETKGRTHTSTASVMVLPSFPENHDSEIDVNDPNNDFYLDPKDIRKEYMRASGAGGQHVNKTESAVRLTHLPTKTQVFVQESRARPENEKRAYSLMRSRIAQMRREAKEEEIIKMRRNVIGVNKAGRSDKIRTYNFSQQRTTDHRSGITVLGIEGVMAGGQSLETVMDSVRQWMTGNEVEELLADSDGAAEEITKT